MAHIIQGKFPMTYYPQIGSVSSGTMRDEDLLDTFAAELSYNMKRMRLSHDTRKRFNTLLRDCRNCEPLLHDDDDVASSNLAGDLVTELFEALDEIAAPYSYFGANEGDGSDYGFWPCIGDELPRIMAVEPIPRICWGEDILLVNDHGNVECGHVTLRGKFKSYWSCV